MTLALHMTEVVEVHQEMHRVSGKRSLHNLSGEQGLTS